MMVVKTLNVYNTFSILVTVIIVKISLSQ